jgi:hypothetical protein
VIRDFSDGGLKRILSALAKMAEKVKQPGKKRQSDQRAFIEAQIEWIAVRSISLRLVSDALFREIVQLVSADFSVPVYNTWKPHIKPLADLYRPLPEHQEKGYGSLIVDGAQQFGRRFLALTMCLVRTAPYGAAER